MYELEVEGATIQPVTVDKWVGGLRSFHWHGSSLFHMVFHPPDGKPGLIRRAMVRHPKRKKKNAEPLQAWAQNQHDSTPATFSYPKQVTKTAQTHRWRTVTIFAIDYSHSPFFPLLHLGEIYIIHYGFSTIFIIRLSLERLWFSEGAFLLTLALLGLSFLPHQKGLWWNYSSWESMGRWKGMPLLKKIAS